MTAKTIQLGFDKEAAWNKVKDRLSVFLDMNCWIMMREAKCPIAGRVKDKLEALVSEGRIVCPLSWGLIEELFKQYGEYRKQTAKLMEELNLNVTFVMRREVYDWEVKRWIQRLIGAKVDETLNGLYAPVGAFVGSEFGLEFPEDYPIEKVDQEQLRAFFKCELEKIGVSQLLDMLQVPCDEKHDPPAYSEAAKKVMEITKGNKKKLFSMEATEIFHMYVIPSLKRLPPAVLAEFAAKLSQGSEEGFPLNFLTHLPALHNYVEIMAAVDTEPTRKDKENHFIDYELMPVPLAYTSAFVARDRNIKHLLRQRTKILNRTNCHYCEDLGVLEAWLKGKNLW